MSFNERYAEELEKSNKDNIKNLNTAYDILKEVDCLITECYEQVSDNTKEKLTQLRAKIYSSGLID